MGRPFVAKEACFARPASDIGELLEMSNINMTISDFDQDEKVVHNMHTIRGMQEVNMLTEQGLYKILFISRKPLAKEFQKWVYSIIKEVRLNGSYTMKKQLREQSLNKNLLVLSKTS